MPEQSEFVRPSRPQVRDLRELFIEIITDELSSTVMARSVHKIEAIADRCVDAVAQTTALDPE